MTRRAVCVDDFRFVEDKENRGARWLPSTRTSRCVAVGMLIWLKDAKDEGSPYCCRSVAEGEGVSGYVSRLVAAMASRGVLFAAVRGRQQPMEWRC